MHWSLYAGALGVLVAAAPAIAQDEEIERGPREEWIEPSAPVAVPDDVTGTVFVRRQDSLVRLEDGVEKSYLGWRIKLLNPAALQLGNLSVSWNPSSGAPTLHSLKIHRDGQVIDLTEEAQFDILRREDMLEQAMLTGILTAVYNIPDLRVGDELEFEVTIRNRKQTFVDNEYGLLMLADQVTPGRYKLELSWDGRDAPRTQSTSDLEAMMTRAANSLTIMAESPETIRPPKDAPPRYSWTRMFEYSDFASWEEVSSQFAELYAEASRLSPDSPLREEAARIASANQSAMARARAALKLVQDKVRYVYVGLNAGNLTPASAEETWQRRYGDCKGKTAMLLALLSELGIPAEAVMVNLTPGADDGLQERLPSPLLFDHVLVRAQIDGQEYWLDGTLPSVAPPSREPRGQFRNVLAYRDSGAGLESIAWSPVPMPDDMTLYDIDASAGFEENAKWTITNVLRGRKALQLYTAFSSVPRPQFESEIANTYVANGTMDEVESASWRFEEPTGAMIMTVSGTGPVEWDEDSLGHELTLPGGGFSPPSRRTRPSSQDGTAPFYNEPGYTCDVTTVTFPADTDPATWTFNSMFDQAIFGSRYVRQFERHDGSISMVRGSRTERLEISPDEAARDNDRIDDFDNSKAIISQDVEAPTHSFDNGDVPPASDSVWLGASAPCLG